MRYIFKFPDIGEGLDEGIIVEWYVEKGNMIESGNPLVKMETDKVVTDIPSPKTGRIVNLFGRIGETIKVGSPLAEIEMEGVEGEQAIKESQENILEAKEEGAGVVGTLEVASNNAYMPASDEGLEVNITEVSNTTKKAIATPVSRAMAKDMGIDINQVIGTGPGSRVTSADVKKYFDSFGQGKEKTIGQVLEDRITYSPLSQIRKTIAKNMLASRNNNVPMTVFEEVEIAELMRIRDIYKEELNQKGIKLSYLPFILKALAFALKKHKVLNAQLDLENERIIYKNYYNVGIAVDTDDGLVVPVIREVDKLSILEIASQLNEISTKSKERKLTMEDMKDGTFTITNYGSIGGIHAIPVINYPQSGILGIGRIVNKPIVKNGNIEPGYVLPLSLSVDHRIVDGGEVTRFLNLIMKYLNDPVSMLIEN